MDSKRLTEIEERCEKATAGPWRVMAEETGKDYIRIRGTVLGYKYKVADALTLELPCPEDAEARANAQLIAHARTDLPDLVAAYKLLRADAAELARAVSGLRDAHRIHLSLCGQRPHPTDGLYVNTGKILERPSVVNLMKGKDQ